MHALPLRGAWLNGPFAAALLLEPPSVAASHSSKPGLFRKQAGCPRASIMKLLTHNMLSCHIKGVTNGYPFKIDATKVEEIDTDFDPDFLRNIWPRIEWGALKEAAETLGMSGLPDEVAPDMLQNEEFLQQFHHALLELQLEEGALICPETGRRFNVSRGIPNLLLNEDEC